MKLSILGVDMNLSKDIFTWEKFKQSLRIFFVLYLFEIAFTGLMGVVAYIFILNEANIGNFLLHLDETTVSNILILNFLDYFILYYVFFIKKYKKHHIEFMHGNKPNLLNKEFIKRYALYVIVSLPLELIDPSFYKNLFWLITLGTIIAGFYILHIFLQSGLFGVKITEKPKKSLEAK